MKIIDLVVSYKCSGRANILPYSVPLPRDIPVYSRWNGMSIHPLFLVLSYLHSDPFAENQIVMVVFTL